VIPPEALDRRNLLGDPAMSRFLQTHLDAAMPAELSFDHKLLQLISEALSGGVPRARDLASKLGLSERSLHRRLKAQGQSFRSILEQAQRQLAEGLLRKSQHSIAEIAFLTGFSEQSAFNRAFKRWTGQTPAAFRG
jgi:AraC-like DNA-binding protein